MTFLSVYRHTLSDKRLLPSDKKETPSGDRYPGLSNEKNREHHEPEALKRGGARFRGAAPGAQKHTFVLLSSRASGKVVSPLHQPCVSAVLGRNKS